MQNQGVWHYCTATGTSQVVETPGCTPHTGTRGDTQQHRTALEGDQQLQYTVKGNIPHLYDGYSLAHQTIMQLQAEEQSVASQASEAPNEW